MARKKETEPISVKFLIMITTMVILMLVYATTPNQNKQVKTNKKTYKELLEYRNVHHTPSAIKVTNKFENETPKEVSYQGLYPEVNNNESKTNYNNKQITQQKDEIKKTKKGSIEEYNQILDTVRSYPSKSIPSLQMTLEKFLEYKGYPPKLVEIVITGDTPQNKMFIASFDFASGKIMISRNSVYSLKIENIIPIIAHEIDHFDNLAKMCKAMGNENFERFMNQNGINKINMDFWSVASFYPNIKNFELDRYKNAIERYQDRTKINKISMYSTLYSIGENFRNPLEESAYRVSDYIYDYYGITQQAGSVELLIKKFNEVDWAIYDQISKEDILINARIPLFDYYFMKSINKYYPEYKQLLDTCARRDNGNLTAYWKTLPFLKNGELTVNDSKALYEILSDVLIQTKYNLTNIETAEALYYRAKTLLANITLPEDIKEIEETASTYIQYINTKNISQPKAELDMILALLCIESKLYVGDTNNLSLYYVKMPTILTNIYKPLNKAVRFNFIYNNKEFQNIKKSRQDNIQDANLLVELLNKNRLKHINQI